MMDENKKNIAFSYWASEFPDAKCTLNFSNPFECLVAVMLSAQTSDESVNRVTPALFSRFPSPLALANADIAEVENCIHSLGLYHSKASHLISMAKSLVDNFSGKVPQTKKELTSLSGVGIKTANVVLAECFGVPGIAVDTHVGRVAKRLGFASANDEPVEVERKLEKAFQKETWIPLHHRMIAFGRKTCHAQKPDCVSCGLCSVCSYFKKTALKAGK